MNTVVLIPDGIGVRNFVLGRFLELVSQRGPVHALHQVPDDLLDNYAARTNGKVEWHPLRRHRDEPLSSMLRNCLSYAQCFWVDNYPLQVKRRIPSGCSISRTTMLRTAKALGWASASPRGIQRLERLHTRVANRLPEVEHYRQLLEKIAPTVLFCSHQRPNEVLAPVIAAKSLGIPTATFIFSWDNLSSKGRIAAPFDHYLVWSSHMRDELIRYYPDVSDDRVHIVGTPQFDPYADPDLIWSRQEFFRRIGADPNRKLICYSGGECLNAIEDQHHLRALMEMIRDGTIEGNPQVLFRPCPIDDFSRFDSVRRDFPELIYARPKWSDSSIIEWAVAVPTAHDVQMLTNLTEHCDLNLNFASTMTLDFAIRDKPVINLMWDCSDPPVFGMPMPDYIHQFEHYRPVIELGAARYACSRDELAEHTNAYLKDPSLDREGRQKFVDLQVGAPIGQSSRLIVDKIEEISNPALARAEPQTTSVERAI